MKICIIGAGSPYTCELIGLLSKKREELPINEIAFMDVDENRLDVVYGFCVRYAAKIGFKVNSTKTTDRKRAICGADFVNAQIRVGGNRARAADERAVISEGLIGQETTGAAGFAKGLRTIPAMLEIARSVEELSPDAWIINYSNPTGLVAEAIMRYTRAKVAGLCSGGVFARNWVANALNVNPDDVLYNYAGLNHMNFSYNITVRGRPLTGAEFELAAGQVGAVDKSLILKLNALPSPYLQYYYHRTKIIAEQANMPKTRGEIVVDLENKILADLAGEAAKTGEAAKAGESAKTSEAAKSDDGDESVCAIPESLKKRGGGGYAEVAIQVMNALYNNRDTWAVVNVANGGILPFLPAESVIETPCIVNAAGIAPIAQAPPPRQVWGLISAVKNYEALAVEAAVTGCRDTALLALLAHPLIGDYEAAIKALDILLNLNKEYLPAFFS
jgi:6-phospho-beta-glucosidase